MHREKVFRERTSLWIAIVALIVAVIGAGFLLIAELLLTDWPWARSLINSIGSLLIVSVAIATVWEMAIRRAFVAELLAISGLATELDTTGLIGVSERWHGQQDWRLLFKTSDKLEILFTYGRTWRSTYRAELLEFARRPATQAIIVLPDPENEPLIASISRQMGFSTENLVSKIRESTDDFIDIFNVEGQAETKLSIWYTSVFPVYSYYSFGSVTIITLYKHGIQKTEVPTFMVRRGGTLYAFFKRDFETLTLSDTPPSRKVFPRT
jgi:hypothetical protein